MLDSLGYLECALDAWFDVSFISVDRARAELKNDPDSWLILDVREKSEFSVSHLPRAIRVPPSMDADLFRSEFANGLAGKQVLVYCSVGARSGKFADRVHSVVDAAGGTSLFNLKGGIFRWFAECAPLQNSEGATNDVHGFNSLWKAFIPKRVESPATD